MLQTLALVGGQMAIGAAAIFGRFALLGTDGLSACAWRMVIASLAVWAFLRGRPAPPLSRREQRLLVGAGLVLALHFATWVQSLTWLPVALSSLLVSTSPLWNTLYETVALGRPPKAVFWLALVLSMAGTALMLDVAPAAIDKGHGPGVFCALAGAACMAAYVILVARVHASRAASDAALGVGHVVRYTYTTSAAVLVALCALFRLSPPPLDNSRSWAGIFGMALISQLAGHTLMNRAVQFFAPGTVTLTTLFKPLFAAVLAAAVFGERLGARGYAGAGLVFAGLALALGDAGRRRG